MSFRSRFQRCNLGFTNIVLKNFILDIFRSSGYSSEFLVPILKLFEALTMSN